MKNKLDTTGDPDEEDEAQGDMFKKRPVPLEVCLDKKGTSQDFDEIMVGRFTRISFHRTLRIPEDGRDYPLPAGLGRFPIHRVEDFSKTVPAKWLQEGGYFIPLYQKEALFLQFEGPAWHPTIAKVCVGKINAISGNAYSETLSRQNQDYIVIPNQKWLDGVCSGEGLVKQFVAMPLGQGYTIEAQITDEERFGGFQMVIMDAVDGRFANRNPAVDSRIEAEEEAWRQRNSVGLRASSLPEVSFSLSSSPSPVSMGIAAGGSIKQQIQKDTYGVESWSPANKRNLTIHLVNSMAYKEITGIEPPSSPITVAAYEQAKIPWFSHYDETVPVVKPPSIFKRILGISAIDKKRGIIQQDDAILRFHAEHNIQRIRTPDKNQASSIYRSRAYESQSKEWWDAAIRQISYVIDLNADVCAEDFALRSCCNFQLGRFRDGAIDGSLALEKNKKCVEGLLWRAYCRMSIDDYDGVSEDASLLINFPETHLIGLHLKAETALLKEDYADAIEIASDLHSKQPEHPRAKAIIIEAKQKRFWHAFENE